MLLRFTCGNVVESHRTGCCGGGLDGSITTSVMDLKKAKEQNETKLNHTSRSSGSAPTSPKPA
jgi:hypothetical protein